MDANGSTALIRARGPLYHFRVRQRHRYSNDWTGLTDDIHSHFTHQIQTYSFAEVGGTHKIDNTFK